MAAASILQHSQCEFTMDLFPSVLALLRALIPRSLPARCSNSNVQWSGFVKRGDELMYDRGTKE